MTPPRANDSMLRAVFISDIHVKSRRPMLRLLPQVA
jgi:hypothetical protein